MLYIVHYSKHKYIIIIFQTVGQDQLSGFRVNIRRADGWPEETIYTDTAFYTDGFYSISVNPPRETIEVVIRRDSLITLCEVDVFGGLTHYICKK